MRKKGLWFLLPILILLITFFLFYYFFYRPWPALPAGEHTGGCLLGLPPEQTPGRFYLVFPFSGQVAALDIYGPGLEPDYVYGYSMVGTAGGEEDGAVYSVDYDRGSAQWRFGRPALPPSGPPSGRFCPSCAAAMARLAGQSGPGTALRGGAGLARGDHRFCYSARRRTLTVRYTGPRL